MTHASSPIAFAHRGGMAHMPENTLDAFRLALKMGATGLETDAWLTKDQQVVLAHDEELGHWWNLRRRRIREVNRDELPSSIPTFQSLIGLSDTQVDIFVDVKDSKAAPFIIDIAKAAGAETLSRLWLAHDGYDTSDWRLVASWRQLSDVVKLVDSTTIKRFDCAAKEYAERAVTAGINAINLPARDWSQAYVDIFREAGLLCLGFRAHRLKDIQKLAALGVDGIHSNYVDRLTSVLGLRSGTTL